MIRFNLEKTLESIGITKNKLAVLAEIRPNTINDLANGSTKRIEIETIDKILENINQISFMNGLNKTFQIGDIIEFTSENPLLNNQDKLMSHETFLKIKQMLSEHQITTTIEGLKYSNILEMLTLYEETINRGLSSSSDSNSSPSRRQINVAMNNILGTLVTLDLIEFSSNSGGTSYSFSKKGKYFMNLLKQNS